MAFVSFVADPVLRDLGVRAQAQVTDSDLEQASGGRTVAIRALSGGAVTDVPLEVYVARVLAGEGEPNAPEATQQALAVAIRTYAIFNAGRHRRDGFDLCDSTHCQVPRPATAASRRAALATAGRILTYRGAAAEIFYSASCGGRSETADAVWPNANLPYLKSVKDDVHDDDDPWTLEVPLDDVEAALRRQGFEGTLKDVDVDARTSSRRVARLELSGMQPDVITGEQFRVLIGGTQIKSTAFDVSKRGRTLRFKGRGWGHGVGMCVIGAGRRARRGDSADEILDTYYPGLKVARMTDVRLPEVRLAAGGPPRLPVEAAAAAPPAATPRPAPAAPRAAAAAARAVQVTGANAADVERVAVRAHAALAKALGVTAAPVSIELHQSLDAFRAATGAPWWATAVTDGSRIDVAPAGVLAQQGGIELAVRLGIAEALVRPHLDDERVWVRVGAARYFARADMGSPVAAPSGRIRCPADAELTLAISAAAQRDAEARAEACFARAYAESGDWRRVR